MAERVLVDKQLRPRHGYHRGNYLVITAGHAFSHLIKTQHEEQHRLVTHGIYGFVRHLGYSGFLIWSVGTQIMLLNPMCIIAFTVVVWKFFERRISHEEFYLALFFGDEYNQ